jgi:hypothetical protein
MLRTVNTVGDEVYVPVVHAAEDYSVDAVDVYTAFYVMYAPCDSADGGTKRLCPLNLLNHPRQVKQHCDDHRPLTNVGKHVTGCVEIL